MISLTKQSLQLLQNISDNMVGSTFHHHYHILYDLPIRSNGNYVEIGCYAGGSACLMLQRDNVNVYSIDLGYPFSKEIVLQNIEKFNVKKNNFNYILGNSHSQDTLEKLKKYITEIDILFIDGDHSFEGVVKDFTLYQDMVISGGFIVFDDYNDHEHSPQVNPAVNYIIENIKDYEVIGSIANKFDARPIQLKEGNCFVLKKK